MFRSFMIFFSFKNPSFDNVTFLNTLFWLFIILKWKIYLVFVEFVKQQKTEMFGYLMCKIFGRKINVDKHRRSHVSCEEKFSSFSSHCEVELCKSISRFSHQLLISPFCTGQMRINGQFLQSFIVPFCYF